MAEKEVDLLGEAIAGTEAEIFGEAVDGVETDTEAGEQPDKSLEEMEEAPGAEASAEDEEEGEAEGDEPAEPTRDKQGKFAKVETPDNGEQAEAADAPPRSKGDTNVPLSAERSRRQALEAELKTEREAGQRTLADMKAQLELTLREIAAMKQAPVQQPVKTDEPQKTKPDIFTDPEGHDKWIEDQISERVSGVKQELSNLRIEASMVEAHERHGDKFEAAFEIAKNLDRSQPANQAVLRAIREAPNPGAALMRWHQQQETLREVGPDPVAYVNRKVEAALAAKMKDPEFRKQMLADMQAEARGGSAANSGKPRTIIRTPPSLNGTAGRGEQQLDPRVYDNSEGAVFESAFGD